MFNVKGIAQLTGTVPVQTPTGGFAVEGDAYANTPTAGIGDWFADYGTYPGTGGGLFNLDGSVIDPTMSYFLQDGWKGGPVDLTVFATDNKINQNPNDYYWKRGDAPAKNEIENVGVHFTYGSAALGGNPDDLWCLFAGDRMVTNGDSYLDFEFLQKPLTMVVTGQDSQGYDNGKFESQGLDGGRTVGDLLVTIEFHNGGVTATIVIQRWEFVSGTYKYVVYPNSDFVGSIYATNNTVLTNVPFDAFGENYYVVNQWAEGAINLTQVLNLGQNPCYNLSTVFVRTRTSGESGTSQLKDFPGGPIQLNLNLSKLAVHCPTPVTLPSCTSVADLQTAFSNWKDGFSNSGGIEPVMEKFEDLQGNSVNIYNLLPPERCGGTVELKYIITDYCGVTKNCTSSFTILPDHDAPVFAPAPEEVMVSCIGDVPAMTELGWTDNCDGEGSVEGKDVSDGKSCPETITRSWYYMDACGNEAFASQTIVVHDQIAPVFAPAPEEVMVSCIGDVPAMTELGWTDNCDGEGSVEGKDVSDGKSCPETITRSWYYMDACGNEAFASQTIVVHDQIAPVFAPAPEEVMVSCIGDVPAMTELGWTDNCDGEGSVEGKDVSDGKSCPETITRSWYYMDACGNEAFASQTIVVHDQIAPVFAPAPEEVMVSCIGDVPAMTELGWTDNCDGEGSVEGKDVSDGKSCPETITRSWYYMDACGNEAFASQTIVVHDQIAPVFAPAPEEVMVSCIGDVPAMTELGWTDNCDGEGSVEGKDVSDGKSCPETITRSWYYMDACGNEAFASQTIVVHDQIAPVFAPAPEEVMVSCIGDVPAMTELGWTDNCDGEGSVEGKDVSDGKSCPETITRSWYYMDACGNEAFASQTIVVHDQIAPVFAPAPEEVMVSCIGDVPAMTELGWTDNCDGEGSVEGKDVSDGKSCPETITRSWYYMDACGNEAFASQTIVVHDQIAPVFAPAPEEVMVSCIGDVPAMTELGWTDNCDGEGSVEGKDVSDGKSCPETITRSWYYMDACGNEAFASQTIVVHDQIAPVFAPAPEEVMVSCIGDVPAMTELGWTDNCDGEGSVEGKDVSDGKSCPETITRSWYYMDACGNEAFASQTIVVHDQIAPVFAPAPEEVMVSCIGDVPAMTELGWTDNCDGEGSVEGKDVSDGKSCPETITRSWYYMDACGNEAFASQTIVVHDQIAPVFAPAPEEVMVSCIGDVPAMTELGWTDNCDGEGSVEGKDVSDGKSCPETITRSWYYMDACGNEAFASQTIVVHDQIAPVFAPAPEEVMVSCIGDVPAMTELGWTDNCDGEGSVEGKDVSDGKSCPETITRSWYYMDACGNEAFASQTIVVHDQIAPVFAPAPEEVMVSCIGDVPAMTELGWTDNCDGEGSVEGKDVSDGKSCPETITRSWYYMDACGNEAFASQTIVVHDQIAPVFAPAPEEVMVSCIGDVPAMTELGWTDNCDGEGSVEGKDVSDGKSCPETITRSWYYMDACGNEAFASQTIVVHDQIAPVFAPAPEEVMVSCIGDVPAMTELGWTDNCDGEGSVEGKDVSDGKSCPETITRSWYYMDACGNEAFASQTIVVHDQIAPVFAPAPEEVMVSCIGDVPAMTELGWTDNCDGEGSVEGKDVSDGKSCPETITRSWYYMDACGNEAFASQTIVVHDQIAPVFAPAPEEVMVSCIGDVPAMTELGWTDNCDGEGSVEGKDVSDGKSCPETITRSWYYMDACGNEAFASQTIVVHDQIAPVFAPAPEEVMVSCIGDVPAMTELGWTDNCDGEGSVEGKDVSDGKSCPETITRSWYYMDACGNEAFASQTIVVHDQIAPVFAPAPEEVMVSCIGDVPAMTELGWTDNCDGEGSVEGKDVSDGKSCPETITRSWYYMDACGNEAFASQTIVVHDQIAPVFAPAPEEVMVSCIGDVPAMTELGWTDNCDGEGSVEGKDVSDGKSCPETITRSWYYMDACGNEAFASQTIVVHDQIAPVFAPAPEEVMVSCIGDVPAMTELGWTDNCDGEGSVEGKDVSDGKSCPETITRSWYYMDACGNEAFASQTIVVHDQIAPVFAPAPEEVMVSCIGDVPAMTELGWTDNCDGEGSVEGKDVSDGKSCPETITRSWYYMDACGNEAFASQTIVVHDQIAPVFAPAPEEVMVSCIGDVPAMTELGWTDNCDGEGSVEGKDVSDGKSCPETITRSWYYMDACGNEAFASQTIVVHDQIAPVFAPAPEEVMVSCIGDVPAMTELGWTDNCDGEGSVEGKDVSDGKSCPETITRSWYYMDACGNEAFASQTIVVHDQIAPVFAPAPEEVMVSCIGDVPAMTELGWTDNCDGEGSVEGKDVSDGKSCPETITRSWYYMDACGNEAFASQTIVVHDQIAPVFAPAPEEVMVSCIGDVPAMTELGWTDNCDGEGSVEGKDVSDGKSCPETITRSWYYMDACGNEAFASQTIVVHDQIAPVFAPAPEEVMVSCIGDVPAMTELGWTDNCDGEGSVEGKDVSDGKSCPETITRSWYYMDACGNEAFASQTIVVHDQIAPVFAPAPEEVMVSCIGDVPAMTELGWTDNCDGEGSVEGKDVSDGKSCPETITRSWYYMDACGNEAFASQTIVVHDQIAPVFAPAPEEVMVSCIGDVPAMTELGWTDNCDGEGSVEGKDVSDGKSCPETITRSWYYMDACGNEAFASQTIVVHDQIAPVIQAPEDYSVCDEILPEYLEATWTDNCSEGGTLMAYGVPYSSDDCSITMAYTFTVADACGNEATEVTYLTRNIEVTHCETAYAKLEDENAVCFLSDGFDRWGWTNMISEEGSYTLPIYQGAAQCDSTKGQYVGNVYVTYSDGTVTVEYDVMDGYFMSEAHVYIGCEKYPVFKKKPTVAPGQYTFNAGGLDHVNHLTVTFDVSDYDGPFYLIAHAVTCETICTCYDYPEGGGTSEPYYMNVTLDCVAKTTDVVETTPIEPAKLKIYPVPFEDSIDVQYRFDYKTDVTIQVYNLLGVLIYETTDSKYVKSQDSVKHIDLPRTSAQTLVVKIITNKEELSKLIISK